MNAHACGNLDPGGKSTKTNLPKTVEVGPVTHYMATDNHKHDACSVERCVLARSQTNRIVLRVAMLLRAL